MKYESNCKMTETGVKNHIYHDKLKKLSEQIRTPSNNNKDGHI